jgi:hypothetical protein
MATLLRLFSELISNPTAVSLMSVVFIILYYVLSIFFIQEAKNPDSKSIWKKNGFFDIATSAFWILVSIVLISSLFELAGSSTGLALNFLIFYYFFFIFLFGILYGLLEWHWPGTLSDVDSTTWQAEIGYIVISIQTQTTLGYTRMKPNRLSAEIVACFQALTGLFFCMLFIQKAIN